MARKILFGLLTALLALSLVGCGGGDDKKSGGDSTKKIETASVPEGAADKAVLAYAQLYAYGVIEDENQAAAGMQESDIENAQKQVLEPIVKAFQSFPLSDENVAEMTGQYVEKLHLGMNMKTQIKNDDPENPVVELTATTIDSAGAVELASSSESLKILANTMGELMQQGMTEEQLKEYPEFQEFAMEAINAYINEFPLNPESSIEVPCKAVKGSDGKMYWAPKDPAAVAKFVTGQN